MEDWSGERIESFIQKRSDFFLYIYTPMCGTCQVAEKMTEVVTTMFPHEKWGKTNINYFPQFAHEWKIESVPCLLIFHNGKIRKKIYAFHSVPYLFDTIKSLI